MTKPLVALIALLAPLGTWSQPGWAQNQRTVLSEERRATSSLAELSEQVAKLRQEIHQLKVGYHQMRIASLERELQQAAANRLAAQTERTLLKQELEELEGQLSQPLDNESYVNLSATRSSLTGGRAAALDSEHDKAAQYESELFRTLEVERKQLQALSR